LRYHPNNGAAGTQPASENHVAANGMKFSLIPYEK